MDKWIKAFEEEQTRRRNLKNYIRACKHFVNEIDKALEHITETGLTPEQAIAMIIDRADLLQEIDITQAHLDSVHY